MSVAPSQNANHGTIRGISPIRQPKSHYQQVQVAKSGNNRPSPWVAPKAKQGPQQWPQVEAGTLRTEARYMGWARRFERWLSGKSVENAGGDNVCNYLKYLTMEGKVAASTQRQACG